MSRSSDTLCFVSGLQQEWEKMGKKWRKNEKCSFIEPSSNLTLSVDRRKASRIAQLSLDGIEYPAIASATR